MNVLLKNVNVIPTEWYVYIEEKTMKEQQIEGLIKLSPKVIRLAISVIKKSRGGFTKAEWQEIGEELLELGVEVLEELSRQDQE